MMRAYPDTFSAVNTASLDNISLSMSNPDSFSGAVGNAVGAAHAFVGIKNY